jgi:hypothetical protein
MFKTERQHHYFPLNIKDFEYSGFNWKKHLKMLITDPTQEHLKPLPDGRSARSLLNPIFDAFMVGSIMLAFPAQAGRVTVNKWSVWSIAYTTCS